jgi:hypothetical protein
MNPMRDRLIRREALSENGMPPIWKTIVRVRFVCME